YVVLTNIPYSTPYSQRLDQPVRTNQIPRQIPDQVFYLRPIPSMLMGGVLPFGAIFIELYFIMNSIWFHRIYYVFGTLYFVNMGISVEEHSDITITHPALGTAYLVHFMQLGFLFLVFGILILTCSEVTILMCYFHLCAEDYHWWWRAFLTSGASAFYVMLYSAFYYGTKLQIDSFTSSVLYFGWSFIMSTMFFILTGRREWRGLSWCLSYKGVSFSLVVCYWLVCIFRLHAQNILFHQN
ncbi:Endomembrane protein 70-domain-containing protein, partial [Endogone sp. FLAS-F59071]